MATTKMKRMTGNDVRGLREGLDMTTVEFGKLLGLGPSAVTRWESKKAKAVSMDPFAARVAEIIVGQSKKLGRTKFGAVVRDALAHEHDLFALWQILTLAFGESVRIVKKITKGGGTKTKRAEKRQGRRAAKKDGVQAHGRRAVSRHASKRRAKRAAPRRAARRVVRAKRATAKPAKAKRAPRARPAPKAASKPAAGPVPAESKVTTSAHKERADGATVGTNGIPQ